MTVAEYCWALTPRSDLLDLCSSKPDPIALFASEEAANGHGRRMYGEFFEVSKIEQEQA